MQRSWDFSTYSPANYNESLNLISNAQDKCLIVKKGQIGYASTLEKWFERFKGIFEYFGAINRTKPEYIKDYIIAFLEYGHANGWSTSEKIKEVIASLPLFQTSSTLLSLLTLPTQEKQEAESFIQTARDSNFIGNQILIREKAEEKLAALNDRAHDSIKAEQPAVIANPLKGKVTQKQPKSRRNLCKVITGTAMTILALFAGSYLMTKPLNEQAEARKSLDELEIAQKQKIIDLTNRCQQFLDPIERANPLLANLPKEEPVELPVIDPQQLQATTKSIHEHQMHGPLLLHFAQNHLDLLDIYKLDYSQLKTLSPLLSDEFYAQLQLEQLTDEQIQGLFPLVSIHEEMNRLLHCEYLKLTEAGTPMEFWDTSFIRDQAEKQKEEVKRRFRLIPFQQLDRAMATGKVMPGSLFSDEYLDQLDLYPLQTQQLNSLREFGRLTKARVEKFEASISKETRPKLRRHYHGIDNIRFADD